MISKEKLFLILTKRFEQVCRGKLPVEENGAVVDVESPAHADEQDLQAAYRVATGRGKDMEMESDGEGNQRVDEEGKGQSAPTRTKHCETMKNNGENGKFASKNAKSYKQICFCFVLKFKWVTHIVKYLPHKWCQVQNCIYVLHGGGIE